MNEPILSQLIKKKEPEWNKRLFDEEFAYTLQDKFRLPIIENEIAKAKGEYLLIENNPIILLKPNLKKVERVWVIYHEFGHHLLHFPVPHKFSKGLNRKMDREANFFAAVALIPTFLIEENCADEISIEDALRLIAEEFNYPKDLIKIRKEIWENYKI